MVWIFGGKFSVNVPPPPGKIGFKIVTKNFTTFLTSRKEIYHLELTLGESSPKILIRADFWGGDATKYFSVKNKGFSVKTGEDIQCMGGLVRISTGKAIQ